MVIKVFLPWFTTITCLELALIFFLLFRYVDAAKSNAIFSGLCLCFACMIWSTDKLVHPDSIGLGLLWYRLQLVSNAFVVPIVIHFTRFITQAESGSASPASSLASKRVIPCLYGLAALIALSAWHPLVLHRPNHFVPVENYDNEMPGRLFYFYIPLIFAGVVYACATVAVALHRDKRTAGNTNADTAGSYRAFAGDLCWLLLSFVLLLLAGIIEFLQAIDWPSKDLGLPVFPRAPAVLFFCVTTAWSLGKQVLANERRREELRLVAQTRLEAMRHTQHQVKNALAQIERPLHNVLDNTPPEQQTANYQRTLRAVTALQELHHTLDVALNLARVEVGEPLNLGTKESVCIADFVEALCRRRLNLEETDVVPSFPSLSPPLPEASMRGAVSPETPLLNFQANLQVVRVFVYADALREVFAVLLDNALKYAPSGSQITVRVWNDPTLLHFCVSDQGCGVRPEDQERIFTLFRGPHSTPQHVAGTGIGLTLAKRYVEAHGGRIWVESEGEGKGSAFFINLPLEQDQLCSTQPSSS